MVERAGRTTRQAVRSATLDAAACLGLQEETGRLCEGFAADIAVLRENPLENIRAYSRPQRVICRGEIVKE